MNFRTIVFAMVCPFFALEAQIQIGGLRAEDRRGLCGHHPHGKARGLCTKLADPQAFLYAGAQAGVDQAAGRPREWQQGLLGYGRRLGSDLAHSVIGNTLQHGLALGR
jgi:hypothetical protein